jgi:hypothetical protein
MNDRNFEDRGRAVDELESLFLYNLFLWTAAFVSPFKLSYSDFFFFPFQLAMGFFFFGILLVYLEASYAL